MYALGFPMDSRVAVLRVLSHPNVVTTACDNV